MSIPAFSLVVLCYRSGSGARAFVQRVREVFVEAGIDDYELVLVANYVAGADDPTPQVVAELAAADPRIRYAAKAKEGWLGWDMRCGFELARGAVLGVIDGDGQMPVSDVPRLYALLRAERYDLVKAYRTKRGDGVGRFLLSSAFNLLFHAFFPGVAATDVNAKPKIFTREAYERMRLRSDDWFIDAEIMLEARRLGLRIGELPTHFRGLSGRRSFVTPGAVVEFLGNLVRYRIEAWRR